VPWEATDGKVAYVQVSPGATSDDRLDSETARTTVLVVDDEPRFHETIARYLTGYRRLSAYNASQARKVLAKHHVDVVLLDLRLPDVSGLDLLKEWQSERDDFEVVVVTCHTDLANAVECVKAGAFDFVAKTHESYQRIGDHVERALANRRRKRALVETRGEGFTREGLQLIEHSHSREMRELVRELKLVAATPLTVLLEGESGVGKEVLARWIHQLSPRAQSPFVAINMAAVPGTLLESTLFGHEKGAFSGAERLRLGKFEMADGGTLFLDEISELDLGFQAKLLRALQEREIERIGGAEPVPVDLRIIAATNQDLEAAVRAGKFRPDLWFRLNVMRVRVPPLRQRAGDIPALVELLARRAAATMGREPPRFKPEALDALREYAWPGNVRELENLVMRMVALHPGVAQIGIEDIPPEYCLEHFGRLALSQAQQALDRNDRSMYQQAMSHFERYLVRQTVDRCHGNKAEAARILGISYSSLKVKFGSTDPAD
jgi:DNA-binding NtrC family response regulator